MTTAAPFTSIGPPLAFIDPNMIEDDGLVPAAIEFIRGFLAARFVPGQEIRAKDEDENLYSAVVVRVEPALLFLRLVPTHALWRVHPSAYSPRSSRVIKASGEQPHRVVRAADSPWVLA